MIYLDNAATSFYRPPQVAEAVVQAMTSLGNAARGTHGAAMAGAGRFLRPGRRWRIFSERRVRSRWRLRPMPRKV